MWALRGKDPLLQHLNSIVISLYWLLSIREDYQTYGDLDFVRAIWPRMRSRRTSVWNAPMRKGSSLAGRKTWVFMDWADMDKDGPLCAEQMLFIRALETAADCASLASAGRQPVRSPCRKAVKKLDRFFYDEEKGAYIDTYASGAAERDPSRQCFRHPVNDFADESKRDSIVRNVLDNDGVPGHRHALLQIFRALGQLQAGPGGKRC